MALNNSLGPTGLVLSTQADLLDYFTTKFESIYGASVDLDSDTPDGQWINITVQAILDVQDLMQQIYNMFDPDNAVGVVLDQRAAINGIQRQAGTFTIQPVSITNVSTVTLYGLDQTAQPVYTVSDGSGLLYQLQTTQTSVVAGTNSFSFQCITPGAVFSAINSITIPVTIVLGVTTINNPTTYSTLGINEETDAVLKIRRQQSVSLASQGYYNGLLAALENINGVTSVAIYENFTNSTDADGVPGHYIWVIVGGSGAAASIAQAIYSKRNAGCGMFGDTTFPITQLDGTVFVVSWDDVESQNLFIVFTASSINGTAAPNLAAILSGLPTSYTPGVFAEVNINQLATLVQDIDPNTLVTNAGFMDGSSQTLTLSGIAASGTFLLNYNGSNTATINWNDSISTIQTKLRAVTGLSALTASGSIASQSLVFTLSTAGTGVLGLITANTNSLETSGSVAITFGYNLSGEISNTLTPATKKNQFIISSANIIIIPMILSPTTSTVGTSATINFTGLGGYGTFSYVITTNNSGGSINATTGVYVSGSTPSVSDTITVTDSMGNTATATVNVT